MKRGEKRQHNNGLMVDLIQTQTKQHKKKKKIQNIQLNILIDMHIKTFDTKTKGQ